MARTTIPAERIVKTLAAEYGLPDPIPEHSFHPTRGWRFDFFFQTTTGRKVALEVEGGVFRKNGGAHSSISGILRDIEKYNEAAKMGIFVYRVLPKDLYSQRTFVDLKTILGLAT
jgi:hypothetical protein